MLILALMFPRRVRDRPPRLGSIISKADSKSLPSLYFFSLISVPSCRRRRPRHAQPLPECPAPTGSSRGEWVQTGAHKVEDVNRGAEKHNSKIKKEQDGTLRR
jgi:hypothetical protein